MRSLEPCPGRQWLSPAAQSGEIPNHSQSKCFGRNSGTQASRRDPKEYTRGKCRDSPSPNALTKDDTQPVEGMKSLCSQTRNIETRDVKHPGRLVSSTEGMYMHASFPPRRLGVDFVNSLVVCATCVVRSHPNPPDIYLRLSPPSPTRPSSLVLFVSQ